MSHHYSGPNIGFPRGDARLDLTDLYAFPKPGDPGKSILIMNVHPSVGLNPPGPTTAEPFAPEARYELKIDTDGDAVTNVGYEVCFSSFGDGEQSATLCRVEGAQAAETGGAGKVIVEGVPVSTGHEAHVAQAGDHRFFAGWRSDPFFAHALEHTGGYSPEEAKRVAGKLLPDLLRYDPKRPAYFPDNGRGLIDDVSDVFLAILTNGKVTGDKVGPHDDFLDEFPYLGPPHIIRSK